MKYLGAKIEAARKRMGLSQTELAQRVGVGQTAVCRWESGKSQPSLANLLRLSNILDISMSTLLCDTP